MTQVPTNTINEPKDELQKSTLLSLLEQNREKIQGYGVAKLGMFGSFVRNEQRPESDVDLLVAFMPGRKSFDNFMKLSFFLEELLGRPVELVTSEALSPYIGPRIMDTVEYVTIRP